MRWKTFLTTSSYTVVTLFLAVGALLFFIPKYFVLERFFADSKIFVLAKGVKEGVSDLIYSQGRVFYQGQAVGNFTELNFYLLPLPGAQWLCQRGQARASLKPLEGAIRLEFNRFGCTVHAQSVEGNLDLKENTIFGKLTIKNLRAKGNYPPIEEIVLNFKGKTFEGTIKTKGITLKGRGKIEFNLWRLENATIEATFAGSGLKITVEGKLFNPRVVVR